MYERVFLESGAALGARREADGFRSSSTRTLLGVGSPEGGACGGVWAVGFQTSALAEGAAAKGRRGCAPAPLT
eukprot:1838449-Pleurochrysis_carterae.AAC.1